MENKLLHVIVSIMKYSHFRLTSIKYRRSIIEQRCRSDGARGGTIIGISFQSSRLSLSAVCRFRVISRMTRSSSFCLPWALNIALYKEKRKEKKKTTTVDDCTKKNLEEYIWLSS